VGQCSVQDFLIGTLRRESEEGYAQSITCSCRDDPAPLDLAQLELDELDCQDALARLVRAHDEAKGAQAGIVSPDLRASKLEAIRPCSARARSASGEGTHLERAVRVAYGDKMTSFRRRARLSHREVHRSHLAALAADDLTRTEHFEPVALAARRGRRIRHDVGLEQLLCAADEERVRLELARGEARAGRPSKSFERRREVPRRPERLGVAIGAYCERKREGERVARRQRDCLEEARGG